MSAWLRWIARRRIFMYLTLTEWHLWPAWWGAPANGGFHLLCFNVRWDGWQREQ